MASGTTVRDRKKESFWRGHLKAQARGGLSVAAYCRRQSLREHGFYWWRRELAQRDAVAPAAFVPVHVALERPAAAAVEQGGIEILLPGDRRVRVIGGGGAAVDRRMLVEVLFALEEVGREGDRRC
jgi:hypothetical protein